MTTLRVPPDVKHIQTWVHAQAESLVSIARANGVVLTISTHSIPPYQMGKYDLVVETRLTRQRYAATPEEKL
jgi:ribonuclease BN (tRNA processing enzyme)